MVTSEDLSLVNFILFLWKMYNRIKPNMIIPISVGKLSIYYEPVLVSFFIVYDAKLCLKATILRGRKNKRI